MKTYTTKESDISQKRWYLADAKGKVLGRLAGKIARTLTGKGKSIYTPHLDCGDGVIVINAKDIVVTGKKLLQKKYTSYSGYPGGLKVKTLETMLEERPTEVIRHAVKGMLPKNKLGRGMLSRLKVYPASEHPHEAQMPIPLE